MAGITIRVAASLAELKANLAEGRNQIEVVTQGMQKLADSLSGEKLFQRAHNVTAAIKEIGGASKLTAAESERHAKTLDAAIEKYEAMGRTAPTAMIKTRDALKEHIKPAQDLNTRMVAIGAAIGSFVGSLASDLARRGVSTLVDMAAQSFSVANRISDLATRTGLSVGELQRMQYAAAVSGASLEGMAGAAQQLGQRIAGGGDTVQAGLRAMGLELNALREMRPDEQFRTVATALAGMSSEQDRNLAATRVFGKGANEILVALGNDYANLTANVSVATDEQIRTLNAAKSAWDTAFASAQQSTLNAAGAIAQTSVRWTAFLADLANTGSLRQAADLVNVHVHHQDALSAALAFVTAAQRGSTAETAAAGPAIDHYRAQLAVAREEVAALTSAQRAEIAAAQAMGVSTTDITGRFNLSAAALRVLADQQRESERATEAARKGLQSTWSTLTLGTDLLRGQAQQVGTTRQEWIKFEQDLERANRVIGSSLTLQIAPDPAPLTAYQQALQRFNALVGESTANTDSLAAKLAKLGVPPDGPSKWAAFGDELAATIQRTIEHGGLNWTTIGQSVGGVLGKHTAEKIGDLIGAQGAKLGESLGGSAGKALGAAAPAIGTALGAVAGSVLGPLLAAVVKGVQSEETIEVSPRRDQFFAQFQEGGFGGQLGGFALHLAFSNALTAAGRTTAAANQVATDIIAQMQQAKSYQQYAAAEAAIIASMREHGVTRDYVLEQNRFLVEELSARLAGVSSFADRTDIVALVDRILAGETIVGSAPISHQLFGMGGKGNFSEGTPDMRFMDFARGTPAMLHGREAVVPERRAGEFAARHVSMDRVVAEIGALRRDLPRTLAIAFGDALALHGRGLV